MKIVGSMGSKRSNLNKVLSIAWIASGAFAAMHGSAIAADCTSMAAPGLDWSECSKRSIIIPNSDLEGANLSGTDFTGTDLSGANLASATFEKASLMRSSLADAKAEKTNFKRIEAYRATFTNISADGASFSSAELQRANFNGASLKGANFEKAELGRTDFNKAILTDVKFSLANLSRADLTGATVDGKIVFDRAFMYRTKIEGLDLSGAQGLLQAQVDLTCGSDSTKLPSGLSAPTSWPCAPD